MKKLFIFIMILIFSILLLYISLFIGEFLVSVSFLAVAVLYTAYRRTRASLTTLSLLLAEAVLVLMSFTLIHKFDEMLKTRFSVEQVYPIKPNQEYKSILVSIENIANNEPVNAAELYLSYDKYEVAILEVRTLDEFLKITLSTEVDEKNGEVYIAGGLPNPGYNSKSALFAQIVLSQSIGSKNELSIGKASRILANDGKGTDLSVSKDGPYFKLREIENSNTVTSEDITNTRKVLNVTGFENSADKGKINIVAKFFLALNSKVLKK